MLKVISNFVDYLSSKKIKIRIGLVFLIFFPIDVFVIRRINYTIFGFSVYALALLIFLWQCVCTIDLLFYRLPNKLNYNSLNDFKNSLLGSVFTLFLLGFYILYILVSNKIYLNETSCFFIIIVFHIIVTLFLSYLMLSIIIKFSKHDVSSYFYPILYKAILAINFFVGVIFIFFYFQLIRFISVEFEIQKLDPTLNESLIHFVSDYSNCLFNSDKCIEIENAVNLLRFEHFSETPIYTSIQFYFHTYIFLFFSSLAPTLFQLIKKFYHIND